ncbi:MAG: hypothetical protein WC087_02945 [Candidatus Paceibacterota bacterium]
MSKINKIITNSFKEGFIEFFMPLFILFRYIVAKDGQKTISIEAPKIKYKRKD